METQENVPIVIPMLWEEDEFSKTWITHSRSVKQGRSHKATIWTHSARPAQLYHCAPKQVITQWGVGRHANLSEEVNLGWNLKHVLNRGGGEGAVQEVLFWQKAEQVQRPSRWRNKACWKNWQARLPEAQSPRGRAVQEEGGREIYTTALWMTLIFHASGSSCIVLSRQVTQSNVGFQRVTLPATRKVFGQG